MRGLVIFALILAVMASFGLIVNSINNDKNTDVNEVKEESKPLEFSTFTSAVCENKENYVYCKDEFFVNCYGEISKAVDAAECNGIKIDTPKTLGFAVFEKDWKDPRQ